jgi:hypothetical protein
VDSFRSYSLRTAVAAIAIGFARCASAQDTVNPADTIDSVEVTARREAMRKAITSFVSNVTRFDGENVARWRFPICPSVSGVASEHGKFMRARIVEIAQGAGAPIARNQEKCSANLFVILTPQPEQLWATFKKNNPKIFVSLQPQRVDRALSTRPVQAVQNVVLNNADGTAPFDASSYRLKDSKIHTTVSEDFTSVLVVVNDAETGPVTFGQLADYVAMTTLARVDLGADFAGADSILRLFAKSDSVTPPPSRLTDWDRSFLKTLYGADQPLQRERTVISTTMIQALVPEQP